MSIPSLTQIVHGASIPIYQLCVYILHRTSLWEVKEDEKFYLSDLWQRESRRSWVHRLEDGAVGTEQRLSLPFRRVRAHAQEEDW